MTLGCTRNATIPVSKDRPDNLNAFLDEAHKFAAEEYAGALMKGNSLGASEKAAHARQVSLLGLKKAEGNSFVDRLIAWGCYARKSGYYSTG